MINLEPAYEKAKEKLSAMHPEAVAKRADVGYDAEKTAFLVPFLGSRYWVSYPDADISCHDMDGEVALVMKVCLLHYLTHAREVSLTGRYITFKELPNGSIYVGPFNNRAIRPLVSIFGLNPQMLVASAEQMGGHKVDLGDWSVTLQVFPRVPITFVLWEGDDEFEPSGNILFDASAHFHLETEDYALLPGLVLSQLKKIAGI